MRIYRGMMDDLIDEMWYNYVMVKRAEKTDVAAPEEQKKKAGLGRVFGRW